MKTQVIEQKLVFDCSAETLYWIIMNEKLHNEVTNSNAQIENFVGGKFSVFNNQAHGETVGLIKYKIIIQNWQFEKKGWPENHFSVCCFELIENENQTTLNFHHKHVPEQLIESISKDWQEYYWSPIKEYLSKQLKN